MRFTEVVSNYLRIKQRENERDLEFFESDLFHFLNFIYIKQEVNEETIREKRRLSEISFNKLLEFARHKQYIIFISANDKHPEGAYYVSPTGVDYILSFRKTRQEEKNSNLIKWVTLVLGIDAFVSIVSLMMHEQDTRTYIFSLLFMFTPPVVTFALVIFGLIVLFNIVEIIKDYRRRKENGRKT